MTRQCLRYGLIITCTCMTAVALAQPPRGFGGRGGPGGPGPGGPGGPREDKKLVKEFDLDENGWLDQKERAPARAAAKSEQGGRRGFGPPGGGRGRGNREPATPGIRVSPHEVERFPDVALYEPTVLRTLFFEFENEDWEQELEDFHNTDVDVPATLTVDGKTYENVGMRFRGASSYGMVPTGYKRSFNVSIDMADEDQRLDGYKTLNLLNSAGDASLMSTILYSHVASQYIPVPKSNHVRVVINGENWGVYVNVQQFDKVFLSEHYESSKGTRWKVTGSPNADGGLRYLGDDLEEYKQRFDMKSNDGKKAWNALVELCRTLNETPLEDLEAALEPMLDVDGVLRFLALDVALVNSDGYWTRASDYSLFLDSDKRFHVVPHDMNEAFQSGRGRGRGPGGPPQGRGGFGRGDDRPEGGDRDRGRGGFGRPGDPGRGGRVRRSERFRSRRPRVRRRRRIPDAAPADSAAARDAAVRAQDATAAAGAVPGRGGPGRGSVDLNPLVSIDNPPDAAAEPTAGRPGIAGQVPAIRA